MSMEQQDRIEATEQQEQGSPVESAHPAQEQSASEEPEQPGVQASEASEMSAETAEAGASATAGKKRGRKRGRLVNAEEVMPRPSYWPLALAFALIVLLLGVIIHPLVIALGALLVLGAVIGWMLERR